MKKKLPTYTFPLSIETVNKYGFTVLVNLLLGAAQDSAHFCRVQVAVGEPRTDDERELGAGLRKILAEMESPAPKKSKGKRKPSKVRANNRRGNKP